MDWTWVLYIAAFGAIIYFMMIRPSRKRADDQKKMMNAMQPGARVMLTSGVFGTIRAMGDQQAVIELAPGVDVTVVKQAIAKVVADSEEEFEYTDEDGHTTLESRVSAPAIGSGDDAVEALADDAGLDSSAAQAVDQAAAAIDGAETVGDDAVKPVAAAAKAAKSSRPPAFLDANGDAAATKVSKGTKKN